jgi:hypothetical protein
VQLGRRDLLGRAVGPTTPGDGLGSGLPERGGLGLAPALGHRFGEVGEQHGEPQEQDDQPGEHVGRGVLAEIAHEQQRGQDAADLDDEDHRVPHQRPRVELAQGLHRCRADDARVEHRAPRQWMPIAGALARRSHHRLADRGAGARSSRRPSGVVDVAHVADLISQITGTAARRSGRAQVPGRT